MSVRRLSLLLLHLLLALVAVLVSARPALAYTIVDPAESAAGGYSFAVLDAVDVDEGVLHVTLSTTPSNWSTACTLSAGLGTFSGTWAGTGTTGTYTFAGFDPFQRVWTLDCGGATVDVYVGDVHGRIWLDDESTAPGTNPCGTASGHYAGPMCNLSWEYFRTSPASGTPDATYWSTSAPPKSGSLKPDNNWARRLAWHYILDIALPGVTEDGSSAVPDYSGPTSSGTGETPEGVLTSADPRTYGTVLARLALASHMARLEDEQYSFTTDHIVDNAPHYLAATEYWGDQLVDYNGTDFTGGADWNTIWPVSSDNGDLIRARLLIALAAAYDWNYDQLPESGDPYTRRRAWATTIAREAENLYDDYVTDLGSSTCADPGWADFKVSGSVLVQNDCSDVFHRRKLLNGHHQYIYAAIGIAARVLRHELDDATTERDDYWLRYADKAFDDVLTLRADGWDHNGLGVYHEDNTSAIMEYLDAARTLDGEGFIDEWPTLSADYQRASTRPDDNRFTFADATDADSFGPTQLAAIGARYADESASSAIRARAPRMQSRAWDTRAPNSPDDFSKRDWLDVLWWDAAVDPEAGEGWRNQCFWQGGGVTVRSGWSSSDAALSYNGGRLIGGHDDPDIGSFLLYYQGSLVSDDGLNDGAKRTALHSTLLVGDGAGALWGQHGDGCKESEGVPDQTGGVSFDHNNAWLTTYLDDSGMAGSSSTRPIDMVAFGSDLTQLYRHDASPSTDDTSLMLSPSASSLSSLERYFFWFGRDALVYDRAAFGPGSTTRTLDWLLATGNHPDNGSGGSCPVTSYTNGSASHSLVFQGDGRVLVDGSTWAPVSGYNDYEPDLSSCAFIQKPSVVSPTEADISYTGMIGHLRVFTLDAAGGGFASYWSPWISSSHKGDIAGAAHLRRSVALGQSSSSPIYGYLVHALRPYTTTVPSAFTTSSSSNNGLQVTGSVPDPHGGSDFSLLALFTDADSTVTGPGAGTHLFGKAGAQLTDNQGSPYAAQLIEGTSWEVGYDEMIAVTSSAPASVGVTWGDHVVWGTVHPIAPSTTSTNVTVSVEGRLTGGVTVDQFDANGTFVSTTTTSVWMGDVSFTSPAGGSTFTVYASSMYQDLPGSQCLQP